MARSDEKSVIFRQLTQLDQHLFVEMLDLLNRTQGRDLFAVDYLDERVAEGDIAVFAAFLQNQVVGVGIAQIITKFDYYLPFVPDIDRELRHKIVGSFATLAVAEGVQGQGIGQQLSRLRREWLTSKNCEVILGVSWVSGLAHTSDRVFEKSGFYAVKRVDNFYYESSLKQPFICPGCGEPPCTCAAILYRWDRGSRPA